MEQKRKDEIRILVNSYDLFDDIFKLAEAYVLIENILVESEFPLKYYKKWIKNQK